MPKPLRRFITPIGFGDKIKSKHCLGFSLKPFLKRLAGKQFF